MNELGVFRNNWMHFLKKIRMWVLQVKKRKSYIIGQTWGLEISDIIQLDLVMANSDPQGRFIPSPAFYILMFTYVYKASTTINEC